MKEYGMKKSHKGVGKIVVVTAVVWLLTGLALPVHGEEYPRITITEIYHKHLGNSQEEGGCYQTAVPHHHQGEETTGGACYQTPVYHSHQGESSISGGCYTIPVYHQHQGNDNLEGGCYVPRYHQHEPDCYQTAECMVTYTLGDEIDSWYENCYNHGETMFVKTKAVASHANCDKGQVEVNLSYCKSCGFHSPTIHSYSKVICGMDEGALTGYELGCGKGGDTIEEYETSCGKSDTAVESYQLSCNQAIEGYALDCGLTEESPCGRLVITNETEGQQEQVRISARLEDFTNGRLQLEDEPYEWRNHRGDLLGIGEEIIVEENGTYSVVAKLKNQDVDEAGLRGSIIIANVFRPQLPATPEPTTAGETTSDDEPASMDELIADSIPMFQPVTVIEMEEVKTEAGLEKKITLKKETEEEYDIPDSIERPLKKETVSVVLPEKEAAEEASYTIREQRKTSIWNNPVVKIIAITAGVAIFLVGSMLLLLYFKCSVRIFNDNGEGKMVYLGRCVVRVEENEYAITIRNAMLEKTFTNRYCIKPDLFLLGKKEGQELIIYKEGHRIAVCLEKRMIVMI